MVNNSSGTSPTTTHPPVAGKDGSVQSPIFSGGKKNSCSYLSSHLVQEVVACAKIKKGKKNEWLL